MRSTLPALIALLILLRGTPAFAHKVNVFATVEGRTIRGEVYFRGGAAAQNAKVEVLDPAGEKLAEATTDQQGKFSLEARYRCNYRLVADAGEGHAGEYTVEAGELPDDLPARGSSATSTAGESPPPVVSPHPTAPAAPAADDARLKEMLETAVAKQIGLLRRDLDRYQAEIRLRDILGGIGYIVGITGLLFYFLGIRRKGRQIDE
jgi:nickel transport protein